MCNSASLQHQNWLLSAILKSASLTECIFDIVSLCRWFAAWPWHFDWYPVSMDDDNIGPPCCLHWVPAHTHTKSQQTDRKCINFRWNNGAYLSVLPISQRAHFFVHIQSADGRFNRAAAVTIQRSLFTFIFHFKLFFVFVLFAVHLLLTVFY